MARMVFTHPRRHCERGEAIYLYREKFPWKMDCSAWFPARNDGVDG